MKTLTIDDAVSLINAFGDCTTVGECYSPSEVIDDINKPNADYGAGGDVAKWADIAYQCELIQNGFKWDDRLSEEANKKAEKEIKEWHASVKKNVEKWLTNFLGKTIVLPD